MARGDPGRSGGGRRPPEAPAGAPVAQPRDLIVDLYGAYLQGLGGWISIADTIRLLDDLGVDEQSVRASISRLKRRGRVEREVRDGVVGYALSDLGRQRLREADRRIHRADTPAELDDGWVLVMFSVPESERSNRYLIRSRLQWLGFGKQGTGVWIAPRRSAEDAEQLLERLELTRYTDMFEARYRGFDDLRRLVRRAWNIDELRALYVEFLVAQTPVRDRWRDATADGAGLTDRDAFVDFTLALSQWRKFPFLDPGLPIELMPDAWEGRSAAELFFDLSALTEKRAQHHVEAVVRGDG
jgi:phenylacetic acid degradation operon negative regulatory protein